MGLGGPAGCGRRESAPATRPEPLPHLLRTHPGAGRGPRALQGSPGRAREGARRRPHPVLARLGHPPRRLPSRRLRTVGRRRRRLHSPALSPVAVAPPARVPRSLSSGHRLQAVVDRSIRARVASPVAEPQLPAARRHELRIVRGHVPHGGARPEQAARAPGLAPPSPDGCPRPPDRRAAGPDLLGTLAFEGRSYSVPGQTESYLRRLYGAELSLDRELDPTTRRYVKRAERA